MRKQLSLMRINSVQKNYKKFVKNVLTTFFHRDMMQYIKAKALWNIRSAFYYASDDACILCNRGNSRGKK